MYDAESLRIDPRAKKPVDADLPAEKVAQASHSKAPLHSVPTPVLHWFVAMLLLLFLVGGPIAASPAGVGGVICVLLIWISLQLERLIAHVINARYELNDRLLALLTQNDKMKE